MTVTIALREGQILQGPVFSEPMRIESVRGNDVDGWVVGLVGLATEQFR